MGSRVGKNRLCFLLLKKYQKNIKKILKKYQKTIDKRNLMCYNKTSPKEKEAKKGEIFKGVRENI